MIGNSGSRALDDEHITMPISVGIPRSEHNGQLDLHVKPFRLSAVLRAWKTERYGAITRSRFAFPNTAIEIAATRNDTGIHVAEHHYNACSGGTVIIGMIA